MHGAVSHKLDTDLGAVGLWSRWCSCTEKSIAPEMRLLSPRQGRKATPKMLA